MNFVNNILTPIIQSIFYIFFFVGGLALIINQIGKLVPNWKLNIKYDILKKDYSEKDLKVVEEAFKEDLDIIGLKKKLLIKGKPLSKVNEITFIFKKIEDLSKKQMKGGV